MLDLGGLAGPVREPAAAGQAAAGFFQGVVLALGQGPGVLGPGFFAQGLQDRHHGGGAFGGQVRDQPPGPAKGQVQRQRPVLKPLAVVGVGWGGEPEYFLRQAGQPLQVSPAGRLRQQDHIRVPADLLGQFAGPGADLLRPGQRDLPRRQGGPDRRVSAQPPRPRHREGRGTPGNPGLPPQPRPHRVLPVGLVTPAGTERRDRVGPGHHLQRLGPGQAPQALSLGIHWHRCQVR
jgi:hypothetical protein